VAKRKRKKKSKLFFKRTGKRKKHNLKLGSGIRATFSVLGVVFVLAGIVIGFFYLEKYVKTIVPVARKIGLLELVNPPDWFNEALEEKISKAASAHGEDLKLDEEAAYSVQRNINSYVSWMKNVKVLTSDTSIRIKADWRRPLALIKFGLDKFYVDDELVVLDYVPMPELPIVQIKGLAAKTQIPQPGSVWQHADLSAAIKIPVLLTLFFMPRTKPR
jgi:hypothetical protein